MTITVTRISYELRTNETEIPFEVEYVDNSNMVIGTENVLVEGENGVKTYFVKETYQDGELKNNEYCQLYNSAFDYQFVHFGINYLWFHIASISPYPRLAGICAISSAGKTTVVPVIGGTVAEVLAKAGVEIGEHDTIDCELTDTVYADMTILRHYIKLTAVRNNVGIHRNSAYFRKPAACCFRAVASRISGCFAGNYSCIIFWKSVDQLQALRILHFCVGN